MSLENPELPAHGEQDWDGKLNNAIGEIVTAVQGLEAASATWIDEVNTLWLSDEPRTSLPEGARGVLANPNATMNFTLTLEDGVEPGAKVRLVQTSGDFTIAVQAGSGVILGGSSVTATTQKGDFLDLQFVGSGVWVVNAPSA